MTNFGVSAGCIQKLLSGESLATFTLQVLSIKKVTQQSAGAASGRPTDRYRVVISDTVHSYSSVMLATHFNTLVDSGQLSPFAVVRVDKYQLSAPENVDRPVIVLLAVRVLNTGDEVGNTVIGNPQSLGQRDHAGAAVAQKPSSVSVQNPKPSVPATSTVAAPSPNTGVSSKPVQQTFPKVGATSSNTSRGPMPPAAGTPNAGLGPIQSRKIVPIAGLSPYQNRWTIRARVTLKTPMRTWSNAKGEGRLFSFNLLDESGEIRATAFTAEADRFFSMIEINKAYYISRGILKVANRQFSGSIQHDYEMQLTQETEIVPCEDDGQLPSVSFDFVRIADIEQKSVGDNIDVIGVARDIGQVRQLTTKQGRPMTKRDVFLADNSGAQIALTLWGTEAENFDGGDGSSHPIVAVKNARIGEFSGSRSISTGANCQVIMNPDFSEAHLLRGWFDREGSTADFANVKAADGGAGGFAGGMQSSWRLLNDLRVQNLGSGDRPDFITVVGTIASIKKDNCIYRACPQEGCNKKVVEQPGNSLYRCEKCQREFSEFKYQLMLNVHLMDATDGVWVTMFRDQAEIILNKSAAEIGQLKETPGCETAFDELIQAASFTRWTFKLRVRMETFNDETRRKASCITVQRIDPAEYHRNLISRIETTAATL